jgi:hypothetical protein
MHFAHPENISLHLWFTLHLTHKEIKKKLDKKKYGTIEEENKG